MYPEGNKYILDYILHRSLGVILRYAYNMVVQLLACILDKNKLLVHVPFLITDSF